MRMATAGVSGETGPALAFFIESLVNEGRAVVSVGPLGAEDESALRLLEKIELRARAELAGEGPLFCGPAALWGARMLYQSCQFMVCRDIGEEQVRAAFAEACPAERGAEADWSADLMLRHLPDVIRLARHLSNADPLVQELKTLATAWPLSSVGVPELEKISIDTFVEHPALAQVYADRIVSAKDLSR